MLQPVHKELELWILSQLRILSWHFLEDGETLSLTFAMIRECLVTGAS